MDAPSPTYQPARHPSGWGKLWGGLALTALAYVALIVFQVVGVHATTVIPLETNMLIAITCLLAGSLALVFLLALGGKGIAKPSLRGMGIAWKAAAWLFIVDGMLVAVDASQIALGIQTLNLAPDWPLRLGTLALLCLGVGIIEESTMRGLVLNGLLARMGRTRAGVYGAVIISAFIFGLIHFDLFADLADPLQLSQNCLKVLQAGMCGFLFAAIFVKTRNLWTVIVLHAANDFLLLFLSSGLTEVAVSTDYVQTGTNGMAILTTYCVICLLYLPFLFVGKRCIDEASPWRGGFYRPKQEETLAVAVGAPAPLALPIEPPYAQSIRATDEGTLDVAGMASEPPRDKVVHITDVDASAVAETATKLTTPPRGKHARVADADVPADADTLPEPLTPLFEPPHGKHARVSPDITDYYDRHDHHPSRKELP